MAPGADCYTDDAYMYRGGTECAQRWRDWDYFCEAKASAADKQYCQQIKEEYEAAVYGYLMLSSKAAWNKVIDSDTFGARLAQGSVIAALVITAGLYTFKKCAKKPESNSVTERIL